LSSSSPVYAAGLGKGYVFCLTVSVLSCAGGVRWVFSQTGDIRAVMADALLKVTEIKSLLL